MYIVVLTEMYNKREKIVLSVSARWFYSLFLSLLPYSIGFDFELKYFLRT